MLAGLVSGEARKMRGFCIRGGQALPGTEAVRTDEYLFRRNAPPFFFCFPENLVSSDTAFSLQRL